MTDEIAAKRLDSDMQAVSEVVMAALQTDKSRHPLALRRALLAIAAIFARLVNCTLDEFLSDATVAFNHYDGVQKL
jgi:hypothetical protein